MEQSSSIVASQYGQMTSRRPICVVSVTYNNETTIGRMALSLISTLGADDFAIFIDNGSQDNTSSILSRIAASTNRIKFIQNLRNVGYSAAANQGIRESKTEFVILLNPDTILRPGWVDSLVRRFEEPSIAAVGPLSNYVQASQFYAAHLSETPSPNCTMDEVYESICRGNEGKTVEARLLIGFCLALRRAALEEVGGLDEALFLGCDDLDLCWRLRLRGYKLAIAADVFVEHNGQASFKSLDEREKVRLLAESQELFQAKLAAYYGRDKVPTFAELFGPE